MKWEALLAMVALMILGVWLVWGSARHQGIADLEEGARALDFRMGNARGVLEVVDEAGDGHRFRLLYRDGSVGESFDDDGFRARFGETVLNDVLADAANPVFRILNITSWTSMIWISIGLGGQIAFFGRMFVQWVVSERQQRSVVPEVFWWLSLFGGVALFTYFVWRRDIVGVLGQTSGVVIYARNLRLIHKRRRRAEREAQRSRERAMADPAPEPMDLPADDAGEPDSR